MKKILLGLFAFLSIQNVSAQTLEKMQWFNEPEQWEIKDNTLSMFVETIGNNFERKVQYCLTQGALILAKTV